MVVGKCPGNLRVRKNKSARFSGVLGCSLGDYSMSVKRKRVLLLGSAMAFSIAGFTTISTVAFADEGVAPVKVTKPVGSVSVPGSIV
jgi:hypothetical protein